MGKTHRIAMGLMMGIALNAVAEETVSKAEFDVLQAEIQELRMLLKPNQARMVAAQARDEEQGESSSLSLPDGLELGAVVELEASYASGDTQDSSDIALATVELGAGWQFSDRLRGDLILLYEEDDTEPMDIDQAFLTFGSTEEFPLYLQAGKMYVPFGRLDSVFVADPVVLELAESRETAALLGFESGGLNLSAAIFNGDVATIGDDLINNVVLAASYEVETDAFEAEFGGAWIRNIMDSDGLTGVLEDPAGYNYAFTADDTGGANAWMTVFAGPATFIAEYIKALEEFDVNGVKQGLKPESLNLELALAVSDRVEIGLKMEKSDDVVDWFAKTRHGVVCGIGLVETDVYSAGLAVEYMKEDFGAGAEDADTVTVQVGVEF